MSAITSFQNEFRFLSNFAHCDIAFSGLVFPSVEHAYVASKTCIQSLRCVVRECKTPGEAKRYGRMIKLRPDWDEVKLGLMLGFLRQKFAEDPYRTLLLNTGSRELIEGNTWGDRYWGVCRGEGENNLGKLIMQVRSELSK